jgi:hypothetical protein
MINGALNDRKAAAIVAIAASEKSLKVRILIL